jgi:hypothetical protein
VTDDTNELIAQLYANFKDEEYLRLKEQLHAAIATSFARWAKAQQLQVRGESPVASTLAELNRLKAQ